MCILLVNTILWGSNLPKFGLNFKNYYHHQTLEKLADNWPRDLRD